MWGIVAFLLIFLFCGYFYSLKRRDGKSSLDLRGNCVVITGSTRGIGKALAEEFMRRGDNVVVVGRNEDEAIRISSELNDKFTKEGVKSIGVGCDVCDIKQLRNLGEKASSYFGRIDVWINNAGISHSKKQSLMETSEDELKRIIDTNLLGTMLGCKVAFEVMRKQKKREGSERNVGHVFIMDGAGTSGRATANFIAYGATKASYPQLLKTMVTEVNQGINKEERDTFIGVHRLQPGMVITDLLLNGNRDPKTLRIFNILAEHPKNVASFLVSGVKGISGTGRKIEFLTTLKVLYRFVTFFKRKNRFFTPEGKLIPKDIQLKNE